VISLVLRVLEIETGPGPWYAAITDPVEFGSATYAAHLTDGREMSAIEIRTPGSFDRSHHAVAGAIEEFAGLLSLWPRLPSLPSSVDSEWSEAPTARYKVRSIDGSRVSVDGTMHATAGALGDEVLGRATYVLDTSRGRLVSIEIERRTWLEKHETTMEPDVVFRASAMEVGPSSVVAPDP
jgi:hypothetical protein